ncbi:hypothetical protein [Fluviicola sp.]|uniref:hypothetical protein n=1 Tax=Fluviicola sp. TaxID=1917219 RepID=UPI0028188115|nr:hypothetical protein [Fluviicola sp.]MDR0802876.1 transposase [Fluviicola sp.]
MKSAIRIVRTHRQFTEEFKRQVVKEFEADSLSVSQLSKVYNLAYQQIYKFSAFNEKGSGIVEMKDSSEARSRLFGETPTSILV